MGDHTQWPQRVLCEQVLCSRWLNGDLYFTPWVGGHREEATKLGECICCSFCTPLVTSPNHEVVVTDLRATCGLDSRFQPRGRELIERLSACVAWAKHVC